MYRFNFSESYIMGEDLCSMQPNTAAVTHEVKFNNEELELEPATDQEPERYVIRVRLYLRDKMRMRLLRS